MQPHAYSKASWRGEFFADILAGSLLSRIVKVKPNSLWAAERLTSDKYTNHCVILLIVHLSIQMCTPEWPNWMFSGPGLDYLSLLCVVHKESVCT